ncbi:MAG: hypothetical protein OXG24_12130 [Gammaproteobacteria bacterium]|nr:hypothetical protein [Gammaproteobacteria bacterium]
MSSDLTQPTPHPSVDTINAKAIYVMYMAGFGVILVAIGAVVWAYACRDATENEFLESHYDNQIRIFWIALALGIIGIVLSIVIVGLFVLLGLWIWLLIQCREGLFLLECEEFAP